MRSAESVRIWLILTHERFLSFAQDAGKTDAPIADARERLKTAPSDPQALLTLAYLLPARGETDAAEQAWEKLGAGRGG